LPAIEVPFASVSQRRTIPPNPAKKKPEIINCRITEINGALHDNPNTPSGTQ
jgi:hypothetical protein